MELRESFDDPEETLRTIFAGLQKEVWTVMPVRLAEDTKDGHSVTVQMTIKREVTDPSTGEKSYADHQVTPDVPIHHMGGGGNSLTHPSKKGDTGAKLVASRNIDAWVQSDGTQQPVDNRMHHLADAFYLSGVRSIVRMLQQVEKDASQLRSDDKRNVLSHHPTDGTHIKSTDPSTPVASPSFDPFHQATTFFEHLVHPVTGLLGNATSGDVTHSHGVTHSDGAFMRALNGFHSVLAHPQNGASLNASNLFHQVLAHPIMGALLSAAQGQHLVQAHPENGVQVSSSKAVQISGPSVGISTPSLSLPSGSISGDALAPGAVEENADLGGDLAGALSQAQVVGIAHVAGANLLPNAASDSAAATAGVLVGHLYRNGSILCVRVA